MRPSIKNYGKPRPVWMRVLGDTLLYASQTGAGISIVSDSKVWAIAFLLTGTGGFFFTKLYAAKVSEDQSININQFNNQNQEP